MTKIQFIEHKGKREYAVVPIDIFERLLAAAEAIDDIALYDAAKATDDGVRIPGEVAHAILEGAHPIKAWRSYRGQTQQALADLAGISKAFLSQIESGKRTGAIRVLKALAQALDIPVDLLMKGWE